MTGKSSAISCCAITGESTTGPGFPFMIEDIVKEMAASVKEFEGITLSKIGDLGKVVTETGYTVPLLENERARAAAGIING